MSEQPPKTLTRRMLLATAGKATVVALAAPCLDLAAGGDAVTGTEAQAPALDDWIPKILAARHPDGHLQTAFSLRALAPAPRPAPPPPTSIVWIREV